MSIRTICRNSISYLAFSTVIISVICICAIAPSYAIDYDKPPDGTNTLKEIFHDPNNTFLAEDIADQIGRANNILYAPAGPAELDGISTVSMPMSGLSRIYGVQYLGNLENLLLRDNELTDTGLEPVKGMAWLLNLNLAGNSITSKGLTFLSSLAITKLDISRNDIGDSNLGSLPPALTYLNLSDNNIGDKGAIALSKLGNASGITLNLKNNRIGPAGMKALVDAGFASLELGGQTITAGGIASGRKPIQHTLLFDPGYAVSSSIKNGGKLRSNTIVWPERTSDTVFEYGYSVSGYTGKVFVAYSYTPFYYTVTLLDGLGNTAQVKVEDLHTVDRPKEPIDHNKPANIFMGWYIDKSGNTSYDFSSPVTSDITIYGLWDMNVPDTNKSKSDISTKYYRVIGGVRATVNDGSVDVTWGRVKSAKGYFIYKYSNAKKKYVKAATLKGRSQNRWNDKHVKSGSTYRYKVQPYKMDGGKKAKMKISNWVSIIAGSGKYSNALKVKTSPSKTIKAKAGKTAKFRATAIGEKGKALIDSSIRWHSDNKKIAAVSKGGKVTFKKKGTCHIWAKAHNGKNSKHIKIVVK